MNALTTTPKIELEKKFEAEAERCLTPLNTFASTLAATNVPLDFPGIATTGDLGQVLFVLLSGAEPALHDAFSDIIGGHR